MGNYQLLIQQHLIDFTLTYEYLTQFARWYWQLMLIVSGNLAFVNHITLVPLMACFDDRSLAWLFPRPSRQRVAANQCAALGSAHEAAPVPAPPPAESSADDTSRNQQSTPTPSSSSSSFLLSRLVRRLRPRRRTSAEWVRALLELCALAFVAYASAPVVRNLVSSEQVMNTSFDPFNLVNTYGYFGRYSYCTGVLSCVQIISLVSLV